MIKSKHRKQKHCAVVAGLVIIAILGFLSSYSSTVSNGNTYVEMTHMANTSSLLGLIQNSELDNTQTLGKDRVITQTVFSWKHLKFVKNTTVRLETEIKEPEDYKDIERVLQEAHHGDVVTFHLIGEGGRMDSTIDLISNIKRSEAKVIMIVDGPVYSADAILAVSGYKLIMSQQSFLMFHAPAYTNANDENELASQTDCNKLTGLDRGVLASIQCEKDKIALVWLDSQIINSLKYLTSTEKQSILQGNEVYLYPKNIHDRRG